MISFLICKAYRINDKLLLQEKMIARIFLWVIWRLFSGDQWSLTVHLFMTQEGQGQS
jgi:hypothetical protein